MPEAYDAAPAGFYENFYLVDEHASIIMDYPQCFDYSEYRHKASIQIDQPNNLVFLISPQLRPPFLHEGDGDKNRERFCCPCRSPLLSRLNPLNFHLLFNCFKFGVPRYQIRLLRLCQRRRVAIRIRHFMLRFEPRGFLCQLPAYVFKLYSQVTEFFDNIIGFFL